MHRMHRQTARPPFGAQIDSCGNLLVVQKRQDVIAVHPFVRRRVDLQPIAEIKQPLGPAAFPDQRIERRKQGTGHDFTRHFWLGQTIGRLSPALHFAGQQFPGLDQLGQTWTTVRKVQAEIITQVLLRTDPQGRCRMPQQAALGLVFTQDGVRKHRRGNHPLRQIVEPFESAPSGNGHFTGSEQPFQRMLFRAPVPPGAGPFLTGRQAAGPQRALLLDRRQHPANCVLLLTTEARQLLINVLTTSRTLHAPTHQREHGKWQQRGFMAPILEQRTAPALTPGSLVE
ncbi:hypothetical protein D3C81_1409840 [compost metagenome]